MALKYSDLADQWGIDQLVHFPLDRFGDRIQFSRELLPPGGAMPAEVPILFTTQVPENIELFNVIEFQIGEQEPLRLIVLGTAPDNHDLLFCVDTASGVVALLDPSAPGIELVNSTFALFVEFLYYLSHLISIEGGEPSATRARQLRDELSAADPPAFADTESWWSIAFTQLVGSE